MIHQRTHSHRALPVTVQAGFPRLLQPVHKEDLCQSIHC